MEIVIGDRGRKAQVVQIVLADDGALGGHVGLGLQVVDHADAAVVHPGALLVFLVGGHNGAVVGHAVRHYIRQVHQHVVVQSALESGGVVGARAVQQICIVPAGHHELELLLCASGYDGESLGIKSANDRFGALTIIGGTIHTQDCHLVQSWDTRFPDSIEDTAIQDRLAELAQAHGATNAIDEDKVPFYTDPASPQIQSLLKTYDEYTGRQSEAVVIGGGTYARKFARACAFGPHDPYEEVPAWVGPEHGADEAISEASLKTALKIYIVSIARLMRVCA